MNTKAITIDDISKMYPIQHASPSSSTGGAADHLGSILKRQKREEFWALRNITFDVERGDVVGIVGSNGAGKSTLLKILSRITEPTSGRITLYGKMASLLEVGTGFHPELTGRENIFLNGAILGLRRAQIDQMFDAIVDFAGVEKFLDTPVKRYSSGMYVRLAFAVAAHLTTDIMIIDEVLAVGDYAFQKKCLGKMSDVSSQQGRTVLFVSHNMAAVKALCKTVVWLNKGRVEMVGETNQVVDAYLKAHTELGGNSLDLTASTRPNLPSRQALLTSISFNEGKPIYHGESLTVAMSLDVFNEVHGVSVGVGICSPEGTRIMTIDSDLTDDRMHLHPSVGTVARYHIDKLHVQPGRYLLDVGIRSGDNHALEIIGACYQIEVLPGPQTPPFIIRDSGGVRYPGTWTWEKFDGSPEAPLV